MTTVEQAESKESQFDLIAPYYDDLMAGVPYHIWVDYIEDILRRMNYRPRTVLDIACGTGNVSEIFAQRGYEVVGIDCAPRMIEVARTKRGGVTYLVQDAADLDLNRTFDLSVSLFDSFNYITDTNRLRLAMHRIAMHLNPCGVFIFDVNTIYALAHHFFDQASFGDGYPKYVWRSEYDHATRICRVNMLFEVMDETGPRQFREVHIQRGHSLEELSAWLVEAGFQVVDVFHAYKFRRPTRRSDRVFFVARRV